MAIDDIQPAAPHPVWNDGDPILLGQWGRFVGLAEPQRDATFEGVVTGLAWWAEEASYWLGRITVERPVSRTRSGDVERTTSEEIVFKEIASAERLPD